MQLINPDHSPSSSESDGQMGLPQILTEKHIAILWEKMGRMYGHKWASVAEKDDGTWLAGLAGVTPEQVSHALGRLVTEGFKWPPSLPEFRELCANVDTEKLERYVRKVALRHYDSFTVSQMSADRIERLMSSVRQEATRDFVFTTLMRSSRRALNAKTLS